MKEPEIKIKGESTQDLIEALGMIMDEIGNEYQTGGNTIVDGEGEYLFTVYEEENEEE